VCLLCSQSRARRADSRQQTADSRQQQTADSRQQTADRERPAEIHSYLHVVVGRFGTFWDVLGQQRPQKERQDTIYIIYHLVTRHSSLVTQQKQFVSRGLVIYLMEEDPQVRPLLDLSPGNEQDQILLSAKRRQMTKTEKILFLLDLDRENNMPWESTDASSGAHTRFQCIVESLEMVKYN
jgi:hypothetical protein